MKLTTKGRYAVTAMLEIAKHYDEDKKYISVLYIAQKNNISVAYLEKLFYYLKKADLLISEQGCKGGYMLSRPPEMIFISQIISAVDDNIEYLLCKNHNSCTNATCTAACLWSHLVDHIQRYLGSLSLSHVLKNKFQIIQ